MKYHIIFLYFIVIVLSFIGCEKKYERPAEYKVDLFANERGANKAYVMNKQEAFEASALVLASSEIKISDSSKGRGKDFFIYKLKSGEILKTTRDSIVTYPFRFISDQRLNLKKDGQEPIYLYLETLKGYKLIAEERNIKYQWLKAAPVYNVEKGDK